jgi:hypothetical protein
MLQQTLFTVNLFVEDLNDRAYFALRSEKIIYILENFFFLLLIQ